MTVVFGVRRLSIFSRIPIFAYFAVAYFYVADSNIRAERVALLMATDGAIMVCFIAGFWSVCMRFIVCPSSAVVTDLVVPRCGLICLVNAVTALEIADGTDMVFVIGVLCQIFAL